MANDTPITIVGNMVADPELRFTPSGAAVANFTIASTPRTFDKQKQEFVDQETLFMRCSVWQEQAENVSESLTRGTRVVVTGRLVARSWENDEGSSRTVMEMQVDEIGPSLRYATAKVTKVDRRDNAQQGGGWGGQQQTQQRPTQQPAYQPSAGGPRQDADPWNQPQRGGTMPAGTGPYDEPPFAP